MTDQRRHVHRTQLVLRNGEGHDRAVVRGQSLIGELLVEGHVAVAVDRREHAGVSGGGELLDLADNRLVVLMVKRRVLLHDVGLRHALAQKERLEHLVRRARKDVVGAEQVELLHAQLAHHVFRSRDELLIRGRRRVEHVQRLLLTLVLDGVKQQLVVFLEHRQARFAAHRGPATKRHRNLVLVDQLLGLLRKERPVRSGIHHDRLDLLAEHAAFFVDLLGGHEHHVPQGGLGDGHGAAERMQDADLHRIGRLAKRLGQAEHADKSQNTYCFYVLIHNVFLFLG